MNQFLTMCEKTTPPASPSSPLITERFFLGTIVVFAITGIPPDGKITECGLSPMEFERQFDNARDFTQERLFGGHALKFNRY
jgi:hypothetical protein